MTGRFLVKLHYLRDSARSLQTAAREPVTMGLPCPRGTVSEPVHLAIDEGSSSLQAVQSRVVDRWSDGSVRWVLLDWLAAPAVETADLVLQSPDVDPRPGPALRVQQERDGGIVVDTGALSVEFDNRREGIFVSDGGPTPVLVARDRDGAILSSGRQESEVEETGPIRSTVSVKWSLEDRDGQCLALAQTRCHFFAGLATVKLEVTIHNPKAAGHPGGIWTLGSEGALLLQELTLAIPLGKDLRAGRLWCSTELGQDLEDFERPFCLRQASSGGLNWNSRNHMNAGGEVTLAYRGFELSSGSERRKGLRATPMVALATSSGWVGCAMQYFWQNFPKSIQVAADGLEIGLLPKPPGDLHEIQGGERKTHTLVLMLGQEDTALEGLDWSRSPLLVRAEPEWYKEAQAVPFLVPATEDPNSRYRALVDRSLDDSVGFVAKAELVDEYGWRHFGDLYADHESAFHEGSEIFLSHYNNQYDAVAGFATQFFRHGGREWFLLMDELARHVVDIDLYHTDEDKSTYNHGQFWHTIHYIDARTASHRAYPPAEGVNGGGPSTGNLYAHGLLLHYYLTGSRLSHDAVLSLGQYVIDADDGRLTVFRFLDRGNTGHVSESGFDEYHGPGRSPANAISALLDAYRLSTESRFIEKAEELIRRCVHPADDLEARKLWDAENRWFYTMFLQALGRYLLLKSERREIDRMYHYSRESLLHYAGWAVENEQAYLERPELLEFPTETWAAQDLRKSEMLNMASLYASDGPAVTMRERARCFFDQSIERLETLRTSTYCRPLVLLLTHGCSQAYFDSRVEVTRGEDRPDRPEGLQFGQPQRFVTQKRRALRRAKALAVGCGLVLGLILILGLLSS